MICYGKQKETAKIPSKAIETITSINVKPFLYFIIISPLLSKIRYYATIGVLLLSINCFLPQIQIVQQINSSALVAKIYGFIVPPECSNCFPVTAFPIASRLSWSSSTFENPITNVLIACLSTPSTLKVYFLTSFSPKYVI